MSCANCEAGLRWNELDGRRRRATNADMQQIIQLIVMQIAMQMAMQTAQWSDQLQLGSLSLNNRVVMAALTRERCDPANGIPTDLVAQYYQQRAGAGFILSEATAWSPRGRGFLGGAELYNQQHLHGWKKVIQAVHSKGGKIFIQLVHSGRATHQIKNGGMDLWSPSSLPIRGQTIRDLNGASFPTPKEMTVEDIAVVCMQFQASVKLAKELQFDGIQLHGAHGYLVDTFLRSGTNTRTDNYGGSAANRCRFALQLIDIALKYFPSSQLGMKISPVSRIKDMYDDNPHQTYQYLLQQLSLRNIGFIQVRESVQNLAIPNLYGVTQKQQMEDVCQALRPYFNGLLIANDSFTPQTGIEKIRTGLCDAISFGRLYIVNPDLAERIIHGHPINDKWDFKLFYGHQLGSKGYTDYPTYEQEKKREQEKKQEQEKKHD